MYVCVSLHLPPRTAVLSIVFIRALTEISTKDVVAECAVLTRVRVAEISVSLRMRKAKTLYIVVLKEHCM